MEEIIGLKTPEELMKTEYVITSQQKQYFRNGVLLEKGAVMTEARIEKNRELFEKYCGLWSVYPDLYLELIKPVNSKFQLKFFQRVFLRACVRHGRVLTIAPRAAGKTFICVLALYLICMFRPGSHVFMCSPGKEQGAKASNQKIHQLWDLFPLLKKEIVGEGNFGNDYVKLSFRNGSLLDIMSPLNSTRGNRATCGIIDEFRQKFSSMIRKL